TLLAFFFFQAEDGIRDFHVTGVQTCALPIYYRLEVKNAGGHNSLPVKDNAIYRLAEGLARLSKHDFPVKLNETTRLWFERSAAKIGRASCRERGGGEGGGRVVQGERYAHQ